jgi:hypothetical protein
LIFLGLKHDASIETLIETNNKLACEVMILHRRMAEKDQRMIDVYMKHDSLRMRHEELKVSVIKKDEEIAKLRAEAEVLKDKQFCNNLIDL